MLEFLRRQSQSWLVWVGLGLVSVVFIFFFGPQSMGIQPGSKSRAMVVDGTAVSSAELDARVQRLNARGMQIPDSMFYQVKRDVAGDVALTLVLANRARKAGLRVADDELRCYIVDWNAGYRLAGDFICRQFPRTYKALYPNLDLAFYSDPDGAFSPKYGEQVRRWFGLSVEAYENYKRNELLAMRYLDVLAGGIPVSQQELELRWRAANETISVEFVAFDPAADAEDVSDEELASFREEAAAEIESVYGERQEQYSTPRLVTLRRIYIRKPEGDLEAARARVDELLASAQAEGADFQALARENSENASEAEKDGDMGEREISLIAAEFVEALDGLEVGGVALVEQNYAWSIVRLEADKPEGVRPLDEVRDEIARELLVSRRAEAARIELRVKADALLAAARDGGNARLDVALAATGFEGLVVAGTGPFSIEPQTPDLSGIDPQILPYIQIDVPEVGEIPGVGQAPELVSALFGLTVENPLYGEVAEVDGKLFVLRLVESTVGAEPSDEDLGNLQAVIQRERSNAILGADNVRARILASTGAPLPSAIESLLASAKIVYEESAFTPPRGMESID